MNIEALKGGDYMDRILQNLKVIKAMKASGYTDREIARYCGMNVTTFLKIISEDEYLKEVYENAQDKLTADIEAKFLEKVMEKLEGGDTTDAKWVLERTTDKYNKKDKVDLSVKTIDDIIKNYSGRSEF